MDPRFDYDPIHPPEPPLQAEIRKAGVEVQQLEDEIRFLIIKRQGLLIRRNDILSSTSVLPQEILSYIFECACPSRKLFEFLELKGSSHQHPLLLGAVSSHWRRVAWSTPQLWTSISPLSPNVSPRSIDIGPVNTEIIATYCRNSKSLPIDVCLNFRSFASAASFESAGEICRSLLFRETKRIKSLICAIDGANMDRVWSVLTSDFMYADLCNLEELYFTEFTHNFRSFPEPLFTHIPFKLRHVTLHCHSWSPRENFWGLLTSLELHSIPTTKCLAILVQCTNLVEFRAASRSSGASSEIPVLDETVSLGHLQLWDSNVLINDPIYTFIYSNIRLPAVRRLDLGEAPDPIPVSDDQTVVWKQFFESMTNLKEVRSNYWSSDILNWIRIWEIVGPSIQELEISFAKPSQTLAFISAMTPTSHQLSGAQLPNLKILRVNLCLNSDRMTQFLDMVEMRRASQICRGLGRPNSLGHVDLRLCNHEALYHPEKGCREFSKAQQRRVKQMIDDGLIFETYQRCVEGQKWVTFDWL